MRIKENTPTIYTERLILRKFAADDVVDFFEIMSDEEVNIYLPWHTLTTLSEAQKMLKCDYLDTYDAPTAYRYAICLKENNKPIGYAGLSQSASNDFGYGLKKEFWNKGIVSEAAKAIVGKIAEAGYEFITATHDVKNIHSGAVMKKIGMEYKYSYEESWQPKNFLVTFRMYQLNFDGNSERVYKEYWEKYDNHFIENIES